MQRDLTAFVNRFHRVYQEGREHLANLSRITLNCERYVKDRCYEVERGA